MQGWEENEEKGRYIDNKVGKSIKSEMSELENDRRKNRQMWKTRYETTRKKIKKTELRKLWERKN